MTLFPELESYVPVPHQHVLLTDDNRINCYREAIENMVKPDFVVLDAGFGSGLLSFFAAKQARKVYALESDSRQYREGRRLIRNNGLDSKIELVNKRPGDFVPPEPVDIVIFEMLHPGMFYEYKIQELNALRARLKSSQRGRPYTIIPYLAIHCIQPMEVNFSYHGYEAPLARYQHAYWVDERVNALAKPQVYWVADCQCDNTTAINASLDFKIQESGRINAVRVITKNVLSNNALNGRLIEWFCHYLIIPLEESVDVAAKDKVRIGISYEAGTDLNGLVLSVKELPQTSRNIHE